MKVLCSHEIEKKILQDSYKTTNDSWIRLFGIKKWHVQKISIVEKVSIMDEQHSREDKITNQCC